MIVLSLQTNAPGRLTVTDCLGLFSAGARGPYLVRFHGYKQGACMSNCRLALISVRPWLAGTASPAVDDVDWSQRVVNGWTPKVNAQDCSQPSLQDP
jgi:hypothetical protein